MTNTPTITPEYAMRRADAFGRRTYRGGLVSIRAYDSVRFAAWNRCRRSRHPEVRAQAARITEFGASFRHCRWVLTAPIAELAAFAQHPAVRR